MPLPELISADYLGEQVRLHADPRGYGTKGRKWADLAEAAFTVHHCMDVLDYGCGQGSLGRELAARGIRVANYDPAVPEWATPPSSADLVVCSDVLEHVEPDKVEAVLDHLQALARVALLVVVSTVPTAKTLSDGRQAHISLHPREWWASRLAARFTMVEEHAIKPEKQWVAVFLKKDA